MQVVLAALAVKKRNVRDEPAAGLPPLIVSAVETLLSDADCLITAITISQPVSSLEEGEAISLAVGQIAFEHGIGDEVILGSGHVRVRLSRSPRQEEVRGVEE